MNLIRPDINVNFVNKRRFAALVSLSLVLISIGLFFVRGPNWGIDFTGGTELRLAFTEPVEIGEVRSALAAMGLGDDAVQQVGVGENTEYIVRIQDTTLGAEDQKEQVNAALVAAFGPDWIAEQTFDAQVQNRMTVRYNGDVVPDTRVEEAVSSIKGAEVTDALDDNTVYIDLPGVSGRITEMLEQAMPDREINHERLQIESVGPKVGGELRRQGFLSIAFTLLLILVYVAFRFDLAFAPGAVIALAHDVSIVVGYFVVTQQEFNLPMIGALLTIIGYSLNDTIVIYDRIRENMSKYRRRDLSQLINDSINETLGRTIATSLTTMMAMTAFIFLGGPVIETFAQAIFIGVIVGTYSTIFIATPMILVMQDVRPKLTRFFAPAAAAVNAGPAAPKSHTEERRQERENRQVTGNDAQS